MKLKVNDTVIIKKSMIQNPGCRTKVLEVLSDTQVTLEIDKGMFTYGIDTLIKVDLWYYKPYFLKLITIFLSTSSLVYLFDVILPFKDKFLAGAYYALTAIACVTIINLLKVFKLEE